MTPVRGFRFPWMGKSKPLTADEHGFARMGRAGVAGTAWVRGRFRIWTTGVGRKRRMNTDWASSEPIIGLKGPIFWVRGVLIWLRRFL